MRGINMQMQTFEIGLFNAILNIVHFRRCFSGW